MMIGKLIFVFADLGLNLILKKINTMPKGHTLTKKADKQHKPKARPASESRTKKKTKVADDFGGGLANLTTMESPENNARPTLDLKKKTTKQPKPDKKGKIKATGGNRTISTSSIKKNLPEKSHRKPQETKPVTKNTPQLRSRSASRVAAPKEAAPTKRPRSKSIAPHEPLISKLKVEDGHSPATHVSRNPKENNKIVKKPAKSNISKKIKKHSTKPGAPLIRSPRKSTMKAIEKIQITAQARFIRSTHQVSNRKAKNTHPPKRHSPAIPKPPTPIQIDSDHSPKSTPPTKAPPINSTLKKTQSPQQDLPMSHNPKNAQISKKRTQFPAKLEVSPLQDNLRRRAHSRHISDPIRDNARLLKVTGSRGNSANKVGAGVVKKSHHKKKFTGKGEGVGGEGEGRGLFGGFGGEDLEVRIEIDEVSPKMTPHDGEGRKGKGRASEDSMVMDQDLSLRKKVSGSETKESSSKPAKNRKDSTVSKKHKIPTKLPSKKPLDVQDKKLRLLNEKKEETAVRHAHKAQRAERMRQRVEEEALLKKSEPKKAPKAERKKSQSLPKKPKKQSPVTTEVKHSKPTLVQVSNEPA